MDKRILQDMKESYGLNVRSFSRINGGFKNELWRAETDGETVLVKIFSAERFDDKKLNDIEAAMRMQSVLHGAGVLCPKVYAHGEGFVRRSDKHASYMVMGFCAGRNETAASVNLRQMKSLGKQCAIMHREFEKLPHEGVKGCPVNCVATAENLQMHMARWGNEQMQRIAAAWTAEAIAAQRTALRHEDMTADNVLFDDSNVAAIIDFDRARWGFALHDVGRVILDFALDEDGLMAENLIAFASGYREILPLSCGEIVQSLWIAWLCEAAWWIGPQADQLTGKARHFREEILWLTDNYFALPEMIDAMQAKGL